MDEFCKLSVHEPMMTDLKCNSYEWITPDNEELYNKNMEERKEEMLINNWDTRSVNYKLNKEGFRSDELDSTVEGVLFLGCSFTFGLGLELEELWTYKVAQRLGAAHWNLGQDGGSNDTCYRLGSYWIPKLRPKAVCMLSPDPMRTEIIGHFDDNVFHFFGPWMAEKSLHKTDSYRSYLMDENNGKLNAEKNINGLEYICRQFSIPFVVNFVNDVPVDWRQRTGDWARDLNHPGKNTNTLIAETFLTNNKLSNTIPYCNHK